MENFVKMMAVVIVVLGVIGAIVVGVVLIVPAFFNHGTSTDYAYTVENTAFWHKLWLKDDHLQVYCFDNESFLPIIAEAQKENKKIAVTYQDYFFRGSLCSSGNDKIGSTVITDIKIVN